MLPPGEIDGQRVECGLLFPLIWGSGLGLGCLSGLPPYHRGKRAFVWIGNVGIGNERNNLGMFGLSQTSTSLQMSKSQQMDNDNKNDKLLYERQADFAFDLLRLVATKTGKHDIGDENENGIILSPLSISIALAMVYVGAEGETAEELAKLLTDSYFGYADPHFLSDAPNSVEQKLKTQQFFGGLCQEFLHKKIQEEEKARKEAEDEEYEKRSKNKKDEEEIKRKDDGEEQNKYAPPPPPPPDEEEEEIKEIICEYGDEKCKCIVALANKIYLAKGYPILENYKATIGQYYAGLFEQLDFGEEQSIKSINDFVESMTCKKIKNFFDPGSTLDGTKLLLINAVYFKGFWNNKFSSKATEKKIFHFSESKQKMIDMMHQKDYFSYAENSQFQMLGMPYVDDEARLYILLPQKRFGLGKMLKTMNGKEFLKLIRKMKRCQLVDLNLPKFKLESSFMMNNELEKLGLETAFNAAKANFEGIVGAKNGDKGERGNLHISETFQTAFIEVNEEGSEAAGVSRIVYEWQNFCGFDGPSREPKPIKFIADHPFAFVLFLPIIKWKKENENGGHFLFVGTYPKHCGETENEHESEQSTSNSSRKSSMGHRIWERLTKKLKKF